MTAQFWVIVETCLREPTILKIVEMLEHSDGAYTEVLLPIRMVGLVSVPKDLNAVLGHLGQIASYGIRYACCIRYRMLEPRATFKPKFLSTYTQANICT